MLELDNRLHKMQTQDVGFKGKVNEAVREVQWALEQDGSKYHLNHCLYELLRSPLGIVFGSYIFKSKGVHYPFLRNCRDIVKKTEGSKSREDKELYEAARYIVRTMSEGDADTKDK